MMGTEVAKALSLMNVNHGHFCRLAGINILSFPNVIASDSNPPVFYELALYILYKHPEFRESLDVIPLPLSEWGLDIDDNSRSLKLGSGVKSSLTGSQVAEALDIMSVDFRHFCQFAGINLPRFRRLVNGEDKEKPPLFYNLALYILDKHPQFRKSLDVVPLPFAEWGIDIEEG